MQTFEGPGAPTLDESDCDSVPVVFFMRFILIRQPPRPNHYHPGLNTSSLIVCYLRTLQLLEERTRNRAQFDQVVELLKMLRLRLGDLDDATAHWNVFPSQSIFICTGG